MTCPYLYSLHDAYGTLYRRWCLYSWKIPDCDHCTLVTPPMYFMADGHDTRPDDGPEMVCLNCPLPECDENAIGCRYRVLRPGQTGKTNYSKGRQCPHPGCNRAIVNTSRTCSSHRWYR